MQKTIGNVTLECVKGDITSQADITAIVNAANAQLRSGGGVAGAIHRAAGPELERQCRRLAPIQPGDAVITKGFNLPNKYVIHCLGPVFGVDKPEDQILAKCYNNAITLAEEYKIDSIAFPAISTGIFGYPLDAAAEVALRTVISRISQLDYLRLIRFVLFSDSDLSVYKKIFAQIIP